MNRYEPLGSQDFKSCVSANSTTPANYITNCILPQRGMLPQVQNLVSNYLNSSGIKNTFVDIRNYIKSDDNYREGRADLDYVIQTHKSENRHAQNFLDFRAWHFLWT